ncbi:MAG: hypothetical protein ALECFALPRED_010366 [Alectoria fallacina]|uniref:Uncharacterized protein n=1 Tax=Alectoria fallacina TaxID=1903189 RepID=A0A8H3PKT7_9LECA|nr:MAG: hypothetical protein ALECFALPRED_010366 [Alectoria fallacina]
MPNPFEPLRSSPLAAPPLKPAPGFLPPDAFSRDQWPTWSDIESGIHDLIANTSSNNNNNNTNTTTATISPSNPSQQPHQPTSQQQPHQLPSQQQPHQLPSQQPTQRRPTISVPDARKRRLSKPADAQQQ